MEVTIIISLPTQGHQILAATLIKTTLIKTTLIKTTLT